MPRKKEKNHLKEKRESEGGRQLLPLFSGESQAAQFQSRKKKGRGGSTRSTSERSVRRKRKAQEDGQGSRGTSLGRKKGSMIQEVHAVQKKKKNQCPPKREEVKGTTTLSVISGGWGNFTRGPSTEHGRGGAKEK